MRAYNPLSIGELGRNTARALIGYPADPLPPDTPFAGAGVYTLHYIGDFPAYAGMEDCQPIYVGTASPPGGRQARRPAAVPHSALYARLARHARSIEAAENLDLEEFRCRWLVLDPIWIGLVEQVLISEYQPLWNVVVEGFGINAPGKGRRDQARSRWDTIHPGRPEVANLREREESAGAILESVATHRAGSTP